MRISVASKSYSRSNFRSAVRMIVLCLEYSAVIFKCMSGISGVMMVWVSNRIATNSSADVQFIPQTKECAVEVDFLTSQAVRSRDRKKRLSSGATRRDSLVSSVNQKDTNGSDCQTIRDSTKCRYRYDGKFTKQSLAVDKPSPFKLPCRLRI